MQLKRKTPICSITGQDTRKDKKWRKLNDYKIISKDFNTSTPITEYQEKRTLQKRIKTLVPL